MVLWVAVDEDIVELKRQVAKLHEVSVDTNRVVHGLQQAAQLARLVTFMKWAAIIGFSFISYRLISPVFESYISKAQDTINTGQETIKAVDGIKHLLP